MENIKEKLKNSIVGDVFSNRNFWLCLLINIINKMGRSCVAQPIKLLGNSIGMAATLIGMATSGYYICSMLVRSPFGILLDKLEKRRILTGAFLIQAISFLLYMVVDTPVEFFLARALEGFGFGMAYMSVVAIVASTNKKKSMGSALGLLSMLPFILASLTNYVTLQVRTLFGEKYSFIGGGVCIAVCIILTWFLRFEKKPVSEEKTDSTRNTAQKEKTHIISKYALPTALVMIAVIIPTLQVNNFLSIYGETAGIAFYASYISIFMVANGLSSGVAGYVRDKFGMKVAVYPVIISGVIATLILGLTTNQVLWMVSAVLMGVAGGGILVLCRAQAVINSPKKEASLAIATNMMVMDAASIIINPVGGAIADGLGYENMYLITAVLPIIALVVTIIFYKPLFGKTAAAETK